MLLVHDLDCGSVAAPVEPNDSSEDAPRPSVVGSCGTNARLYTCRAAVRRADSIVGIFAAHVASDPTQAAAAFARRFGVVAVEAARIEEGFDRSDPYASVMISPMIADELDMVAAAPHSSAHRRYEFAVERSFGF